MSTSKPSVFFFVFFCILESLSLPLLLSSPSFQFLYPNFTLCHSLILIWKQATENWVFKVFWCFNLNIWILLTEFCIFCPPMGTLNVSPSHLPLEIYIIKFILSSIIIMQIISCNLFPTIISLMIRFIKVK